MTLHWLENAYNESISQWVDVNLSTAHAFDYILTISEAIVLLLTVCK